MTNPVVHLDNLSVTYGSDVIFSDIALDIQPGQFVSLLGPSGCGKSTILRIIGDLTNRHSGIVTVDGNPAANAWRELAYVFQAPRLVPWRNARDNVVLGMQLRGIPGSKAALREQAIASMQTVGVGHLETRPAHVLSGGEQQRVSIARALAVEPRILLMDEPFSALDVQTRHQLREEIVALWKRTGVTTVFVTHDVDEAILVSNRIIVFSPKPTRVLADIDVDLPKNSATTASPAFEELRRTIVGYFTGPDLEEISEATL